MFRFRSRSKSAQHGGQEEAVTRPIGSDVTAILGLDTSKPHALMVLLESYGVCFTLRDRREPSNLLAALGPRFKAILTPGSAFHYVCGPADQRCVVQVLDLGDERLIAAVCTGENASNQSMLWVIRNIQEPIEAAAKASGSRYGIVSSGHFDKEDHGLPGLILHARVVPIASL